MGKNFILFLMSGVIFSFSAMAELPADLAKELDEKVLQAGVQVLVTDANKRFYSDRDYEVAVKKRLDDFVKGNMYLSGGQMTAFIGGGGASLMAYNFGEMKLDKGFIYAGVAASALGFSSFWKGYDVQKNAQKGFADKNLLNEYATKTAAQFSKLFQLSDAQEKAFAAALVKEAIKKNDILDRVPLDPFAILEKTIHQKKNILSPAEIRALAEIHAQNNPDPAIKPAPQKPMNSLEKIKYLVMTNAMLRVQLSDQKLADADRKKVENVLAGNESIIEKIALRAKASQNAGNKEDGETVTDPNAASSSNAE